MVVDGSTTNINVICDKMFTSMDNNNFSVWLMEMMRERGMIPADLARASGLTPQAISNFINDPKREPDYKSIKAIARAFKIPPWHVFNAAAGIKTRGDSRVVSEENVLYKLRDLSEEQLTEVEQYIEFIQDRETKAKRKTKVRRVTREGITPPETIKK